LAWSIPHHQKNAQRSSSGARAGGGGEALDGSVRVRAALTQAQ